MRQIFCFYLTSLEISEGSFNIIECTFVSKVILYFGDDISALIEVGIDDHIGLCEYCGLFDGSKGG